MNRRKKDTLIWKISEIFENYPREYFVIVFFWLFFFAIIWQTFSYTVLNYDYYKKLANAQQVGELEIPVTRWWIYSAQNDSFSDTSTLASSVDLSDLAIDPQIEGDIWKLQWFLTEKLYEQMCHLKAIDDCYDDLQRFLRVLDIGDFVYEEKFIKAKISSRLQLLLSRTKVTSVKLRDAVSADEENQILTWNIAWVYSNENGVYVNPEEITQKELFAQKYIGLFWWKKESILHRIRQRDLRYVPIFSRLSLIISDDIKEYIIGERTSLRQWILEKKDTIWGFIILTPHAQRIYPERKTASQIIWFIDNAGEWHYGLEWYFNEKLRGNPWALVSKKDVKGRAISPSSLGNENIEALEGINVYSTIDRSVQKLAESVLEEGVKKFRANKGTIVVMEPKTGKILSLANYPTFDPNNPGEVYELQRILPGDFQNPATDLLWKNIFVEDIEHGKEFYYDGKKIFLREAKREEYADEWLKKYKYKNDFWAGVYQNDAVSSLYEPGSIMKAITVAIGLDTGEITSSDRYNDSTGQVTIDKFTIANVDKKCLWYHTFWHALNFSCNIGMVRIVQKVGKALMHKYILDFGFWDKTGIQLDGEVYSQIRAYEKWPTSQLLTTSYGLGISMTPLQMASAYSVLANGGIYMKPYIVEKIEYADGNTIQFKPQKIRRVIKDSTSKIVTNMLVDGVENGVAKYGAVEWYRVAGKTGTSQIAYRGGYEYGVASTYGSFAWFAPAEDPRFVIVVKLERPRTSVYGWSTSAHIFSELAWKLLKYYAIPKKRSQ